MRSPLTRILWIALLGLCSCARPGHLERQWTGRLAEDGQTLLRLEFDWAEGGPSFELRLPADWSSRPRSAMETGRWTLDGLTGLEPQVIQPRAAADGPREQPVPLRERDVVVVEASDPFASNAAHQARARGAQVFLVELAEAEDATRVEVFGGFAWPLEWVRVARFQWQTIPKPGGDGVDFPKVMAIGLGTVTVLYGLGHPETILNPIPSE